MDLQHFCMPGAQAPNWVPLGKAWGSELLPLKNLEDLGSGIGSSYEFGRFGVRNGFLLRIWKVWGPEWFPLKNLEGLGSGMVSS